MRSWQRWSAPDVAEQFPWSGLHWWGWLEEDLVATDPGAMKTGCWIHIWVSHWTISWSDTVGLVRNWCYFQIEASFITGHRFLNSQLQTSLPPEEVLNLADCGIPAIHRFAFYDQVHTTGMDIQQHGKGEPGGLGCLWCLSGCCIPKMAIAMGSGENGRWTMNLGNVGIAIINLPPNDHQWVV